LFFKICAFVLSIAQKTLKYQSFWARKFRYKTKITEFYPDHKCRIVAFKALSASSLGIILFQDLMRLMDFTVLLRNTSVTLNQDIKNTNINFLIY